MTGGFIVSKRLCALLALAFLLLALPFHADVGPKPSVDFSVVYDVQPAPRLLNATLLLCNLPGCLDARPMIRAGPQRIECYDQTRCHARAYGFAPYMQLVLQFDDKNRTSNIFTDAGFGGSYSVRVQANDLKVESTGLFPAPPPGPREVYAPTPPLSLSDILTALLITLLIEVPVAAIAFLLWKKPMKLLALVAGINVITVPALWLLLPPFTDFLRMLLNTNPGTGALLGLLMLELLVVIAEALALWKLPALMANKKEKKAAALSRLQAVFLSIAMNVASVVGGMIILTLWALLSV